MNSQIKGYKGEDWKGSFCSCRVGDRHLPRMCLCSPTLKLSEPCHFYRGLIR